jgi:single-strand DNA-binding protein
MFIKKVRLGRDPELRFLVNQTPVLEFPAAYDYGYGENKKTQWVKVSLFGERANTVGHSNLLHKGDAIIVYLDDVRVEAWINKNTNEVASNLAGTLVKWEYAQPRNQGDNAGTQQATNNQAPASNQAPANNQQPANQRSSPANEYAAQSGGRSVPARNVAQHQTMDFDDFNDDIPF